MLGAIWGHLGVPPNLGAKWPPWVQVKFGTENIIETKNGTKFNMEERENLSGV